MKDSKHLEAMPARDGLIVLYSKDGRNRLVGIQLLPVGTYMQNAGLVSDIMEAYDKYIDAAITKRR